MSTAVLVLTLLAGGAGSALRYVVDHTAKTRFSAAARYPWGTTAINVSGSLLLGILTGITTLNQAAPAWSIVVGTGLIGGYTTFSTASVETTRMILEHRYRDALTHGVLTAAACVAAAGAGLALPQLL